MPKPKKSKEPKIPPEELLHTLLQQQEERAADEQRRLREKAAQNLKEYNQRRVLLVESVKLFRRLEKSASDQRRQQADRKQWSDFVSCRKPPDPSSAPELRAALYQWTYRREQQEKSSVSWTLAADERAPLTQDAAVSGRKTTRQDLRQLYRNIGAIYVPTVREALAVLKSIEDSAAGGRPEVLLARDEIRKFISDSLDRMTFRVGSNLARDMEVLDPVMCEFQYAADIVAIYFWSFRHVPLPPDYNLLMKTVNMTPLRLILHRPPAFDLKNALIRGIWHGFDHYSSMDPTGVAGPLPAPAKELIAAQELEWNERQEVRRKRLTALRQLRDDYENEQRRKQGEAEALAAEQQKPGASGSRPKPEGRGGKVKRGAKKGKTKQAPEPAPVPAVITDETEVDIDDEYERQQSDQFWDTLEPIGPKSLPLRDGYVNLREYGITGGVYKLARFAKLPQPVELRSDFTFTCKPVGLGLSESQPEYRALESDGLIKIELLLPAGCFWWEEPTVCRWEPWEESDTFRQLSPAVQRFHLQYDQIRAREASRLFTATAPKQTRGAKVVPDFRLVDVPVEIRRHYLIRDHILPRLPEGYRFHAELKQLYCILRDRATRRKALDRERLARNELMLKYDRFLQANQRPAEWTSCSEIRLPTEADIGPESSTEADSRRKTSNTEMDAKLDHLSLLHPAHPRYLHPPQPARRPLAVAAKDSDRQAQTMEELERSLEACIAADDDEAGERLCDTFSTFLNLLEYLREKEKPLFPSLPLPEAEEPVPAVKRVAVRVGTREFKHRHLTPRPSSRKSITPELRGRPQSRIAGSGEPKRTRKRKKSLTKGKNSMAVEQPDGATSEDRSKTDGILARIDHEPGRWSTKAIHSQSYDPAARILTFWTDRLGVFGLAARRSCLLPLRQWDMRRQGRVADLTTVISLQTVAGLEIVFSVTGGGYRVRIGPGNREPPNEEVVVPAHDELSLEELQELLATLNLHLFPQPDTCFYTGGMSEGAAPKHEPMELHNLRCLAVFCLTHHFRHCLWNRYADRRTALVRCRQLIEGRPEPELETIKITPLGAQVVQVEELCSPTLEQILLAYHPRPADQSYNADAYGLLKGALEEPSRKVLAKTPPLLQWNVGQLLQKLRLLSYS